tara:strand:- start:138 stop:434 length:297 start_codon:yes stop_codon:yes gene_type:complete
MKVMSIIRFKPKPENYDEFIDVQIYRNAKKREEFPDQKRWLFQFGDEVVYVKISPSIETLVDQQPESLSSLDDVRHMLEPYSDEDGHTIAMSGVIMDE